MTEQPYAGFYVWLREPSMEYECGYYERRWRVVRARLPQNQHGRNWGEVCYKRRRIAIHTPLSDEDYWSTLHHEITHISCPDLDEEPVLRAEYNWLQVSKAAGVFKEDE